MLHELSPVLYVQLAFRLVQDNSPECKKMAAECISDILNFVRGTKEEDELFSITVIWLKEKKVRHCGV